MEVNFLYGSKGLKFQISEELNTTIIRSHVSPPLVNPVEKIYDKIEKPLNSQPLSQLLTKKLKRKPDGDIVVVIDDHTRPISSIFFLDTLSKIFQKLNIPDSKVKILVSTGLHRKPDYQELIRMIGKEHINRFDVLFHDANNELELEFIGKTPLGNQVYLNMHYVQAAFRITTGYVEPHFFSGYSGGRKAIVPGIAGKNTILFNHSAMNIDSEYARFGRLQNNPIHEDMEHASRLLKPEFCINAILNKNHEITHIAAGNIFAVFNHLVQIQKQVCFIDISYKYDIVICGNGGFPLDLNLYQAVKSMVIGEMACRKDGIIIAVNECKDGVGQESFNELINSGDPPKLIYEKALNGEIKVPDIWEIQVMARVLMNHSVYVVSSLNLSDLGNTGLKYATSVEDALQKGIEELGMKKKDVRILILPEGPLALPRVTP